MKKISIISVLVLTAIAFSFAGCMGFMNCTKGSGEIVKNERNLAKFNKVILKGSADLFIIQGSTQTLHIETDKNISESIITEVKGDELYITTKGLICPTKLNIYITMQDINGINLQGSGDIAIKGPVKSDKIKLDIQGSGNVKATGLDIRNSEIEIAGSGDINISGKTVDLKCGINGSGDLKLKDFVSQNCNATINGSGDITVNVENSLNAEIYGSGDIRYTGSPKEFKQKVRGSGDILKIKEQLK